MAPVVAKVAMENRNTFAVARLNMDVSRKTVGKYNVRNRPTYIVFQNGKAVKSFSGVMQKATLVKNILDAINN